jgi:hypothetical protein
MSTNPGQLLWPFWPASLRFLGPTLQRVHVRPSSDRSRPALLRCRGGLRWEQVADAFLWPFMASHIANRQWPGVPGRRVRVQLAVHGQPHCEPPGGMELVYLRVVPLAARGQPHCDTISQFGPAQPFAFLWPFTAASLRRDDRGADVAGPMVPLAVHGQPHRDQPNASSTPPHTEFLWPFTVSHIAVSTTSSASSCCHWLLWPFAASPIAT